MHDPEHAGRTPRAESSSLDGVAIEPFRLRPGDDASCLNLYQPQNPRILGAAQPDSLGAVRVSGIARDGERENEPIPGGCSSKRRGRRHAGHRRQHLDELRAAPALGEEIVIQARGRPVRLRIVAALRDSVFQSELLMSEANFRRCFRNAKATRCCSSDGRADQDSAVSSKSRTPGRFRRGCRRTTAKARRVSQGREHVPLDVSDARRAGTAHRHGGSRRGAAAQRARAPARAGAPRRGRLSAAHFVLMLRRRKFALLLAGSPSAPSRPAWRCVAGRRSNAADGFRSRPAAGCSFFAVLVAGLISTVVAASSATRAPLLEALRSE